MAAWPHSQPGSGMGWSDHHLQYAQQPMMQAYMAGAPVRAPPPSMSMHQQIRPDTVPRPGQSLPWTPEEDSALLEAKSQDMSWDEIHTQYFPNKTGNACRKRHERLQQKARGHWDEARIQRVVTCYNRHREQFWRGLSEQVGERWDEVEKMVSHHRGGQMFLSVLRCFLTQGSDLATRLSTVGDRAPSPYPHQIPCQLWPDGNARIRTRLFHRRV